MKHVDQNAQMFQAPTSLCNFHFSSAHAPLEWLTLLFHVWAVLVLSLPRGLTILRFFLVFVSP
jgi:hypothetical protein